MAIMGTTTTLVSVEEYLSTVYEPEMDYVDGELEDRNVGEKSHSTLQLRAQILLHAISGLFIYPEMRIRVSATRFRVPDVAVYLAEPPGEVPTSPPFLVVEILSPEDRMYRMIRKLHDYYAMGCVNIWVLDPKHREAYQYDGTALTQVMDTLTCGDFKHAISLTDLFAE
jgi:Uma2 family endonuclease